MLRAMLEESEVMLLWEEDGVASKFELEGDDVGGVSSRRRCVEDRIATLHRSS